MAGHVRAVNGLTMKKLRNCSRQPRAHTTAGIGTDDAIGRKSERLLELTVEGEADTDHILLPVVIDQALAVAGERLHIAAQRADQRRRCP